MPKYGQADKAEKQFKQVLAKKPYLPTSLNLGHLYFTKGDWKNALLSYQQASEIDPRNPHTLLSLARVNQELQNYGDAKKSYDKLKAIDPIWQASLPTLERQRGWDQGGGCTEPAEKSHLGDRSVRRALIVGVYLSFFAVCGAGAQAVSRIICRGGCPGSKHVHMGRAFDWGAHFPASHHPLE